MLNDKVVVVTGGAGLLGRRFCEAIAAQGGISIVADIQQGVAHEVAQAIVQRNGGRAMSAVLDIGSIDSIRALITLARERYGRIDGVVNNAYPRNPRYGRKFEDVTYSDFCENISLHLGGYFLVAQQFAIAMREQGNGAVINMSSIYGTVAPRFDIYKDTPMTMPVEYAAIKAGINHMTRYMAAYFKGSGVRFNCLSPGGIVDGQPQVFLEAYRNQCNGKGMLAPQDLEGALIFLLSDAGRYVNGQNLIVDDGFAV